VRQVDAHPRLKARIGEWYYASVGIRTFNRRYLVHPPRLETSLGDELITGVTTVVQKAEPYTYFGNRPVGVGEGATLESGDLAGVVLRRATPFDLATMTWRMLSKRAHLVKHRHVHGFSGVREVRVRSLDERPLPLQVDGDYIGEASEALFTVSPGSLTVVA
jgi:diacylglycerol kinase family enzyme